MSKAKGTHLVVFTDEQLQDLKKRYEAGESSHKLARIYGIHQTTIIARLRELGATIRPPKKPVGMSDEQMAQMVEKKNSGLTWEELGEMYDINDKTLRSAYYRYRQRLLDTRQ